MNYPPFYIPPQQSAPFFSVDVECVATGPQHNQRAVAHIAVVDQWERVLLNVYVLPKEKVRRERLALYSRPFFHTTLISSSLPLSPSSLSCRCSVTYPL